MRFLGAQGGADAGRAQRHRHAGKGGGARGEARLVLRAAVRERGQRGRALAHDRDGDPRGLQGHAPRLLGHGLRHAAARSRAWRECCSEQRPETRIVVCEPDNSPVLGSGIAQPRAPDGSPSRAIPCFRPHAGAGLGAGLHPQARRGCGRDRNSSTGSCPSTARRRCDLRRRARDRRKESSRASPAAPRSPARCRSAASCPPGANVLCMLPDTGERYLSTPLFADIPPT